MPLPTPTYTSKFEEFWASASWKSHLKYLVWYVLCGSASANSDSQLLWTTTVTVPASQGYVDIDLDALSVAAWVDSEEHFSSIQIFTPGGSGEIGVTNIENTDGGTGRTWRIYISGTASAADQSMIIKFSKFIP